MSVKEIRQLRTQIMVTGLTLGIRKNQTLAKAVDFTPPGPSGRSKGDCTTPFIGGTDIGGSNYARVAQAGE
jgi:hypothetical protein